MGVYFSLITNKMEKKKTYLDVLQETIDFYSEDVSRRSFDTEGNCRYNGPEGKVCGVARCCKKIHENYEGDSASYIPLKEYLLPDYAHLDDPCFWDMIQDLHDYSPNWHDKGLTDRGKDFVVSIKRYIESQISPQST